MLTIDGEEEERRDPGPDQPSDFLEPPEFALQSIGRGSNRDGQQQHDR